MIENLIISLGLTLIIEVVMAVVMGVRKRNDIATVIAANTLTNPAVVFCADVAKTLWGMSHQYWATLIIMEIVIVLVEGKIFEKILSEKRYLGRECR